MSFTWHICIHIIMIVSFWTVTYSYPSALSDWKEIEKLAEDHPYLVALLDVRYEYICTGTSIAHQTVLTSGSCAAARPAFVAISAVLADDVVGKNILKVSGTKIHSSFDYYVSQTQPSDIVMNSNIALVYVDNNKLDYFANLAVIGDIGPLELRNKELAVFGYGELDMGTIVLQQQVYVQKTCVNPQWFYCVCGVESTRESTYENQFGEGAPALLQSKVVAIVAAPCGALIMPNTDVKYNIFTVVTHYHSWVWNNRPKITTFQHEFKSLTNKGILNTKVFITHIVTMLMINYLIN
jgi:hypothetical protein